jgi:uncharacterized protein YeaO (DUF488 family)
MAKIQIKRVYDERAAEDGERVLVDRLWPRGITKEQLQAEWLRDVSPSNDLRKWAHTSGDYAGFRERYAEELAQSPASEALEDLLARARAGTLTLLFAAKDTEHNNAAVLREHLLQLLSTG